MAEMIFEDRRLGEGLCCWEAGSGETIVAIVNGERRPTRAHALLAEHWRVLVFAVVADAWAPNEAVRRIGAAIASLGIERFDVIGEGAGAAVALWLGSMPRAEIGSVVLAAPDSPTDEAFPEMGRPVLVLSGTKDGSQAADRYRALLPGSHFMFVYDAGRAIGDERPEALAFITREFFERRDLFLVSRESGMALP
jgi:pimeloyl-ACP methyl ester carboxylesterase